MTKDCQAQLLLLVVVGDSGRCGSRVSDSNSRHRGDNH